MISRNPGLLPKFLLKQWGALAALLISVIAYGGLVRMDQRYGTLRGPHTPETIGWYLVAFAAFLGAVLWAETKRTSSMRWIWGGAILFRLLLLFTSPTLSDDIYRYLWDGHLANNGVSPYAFPINAPELDNYDIPVRDLANNPEMASPYLPVAQWVFAALGLFFPLKPIFTQVLMVIFDLTSGLLIGQLLSLASLPKRRLLLYLWNPLVVVEVAHGAHIDTWMMVLTLGAVWLTFQSGKSESTSKPWAGLAAPLLLALATLTKILPVLLLPVVFFRWSWRQRLVYGLATIGLLLPAAWRAGWGLAGPTDGTGLFGAVRIYAESWNFNSGLFYWTENWLQQQGWADPGSGAKLIAGLALGILLLVIAAIGRRQPPRRKALRLMAIPWMGYLLLTTTVHPWYALILLAFIPFLTPGEAEPVQSWLAVTPWLYLSGALVFSYLTYLDPSDYRELAWVRPLTWTPTLALLTIYLVVFGIRKIGPGFRDRQTHQPA